MDHILRSKPCLGKRQVGPCHRPSTYMVTDKFLGLFIIMGTVSITGDISYFIPGMSCVGKPLSLLENMGLGDQGRNEILAT